MSTVARTPAENPLALDLDYVLTHTANLWQELRGRQVFISGGTGFIGCWLLESFAWANRNLALDARALVLTRNPDAFVLKAPHLAADPAIRLVRGEVRDFEIPDAECPFVIHAAAASSTTLNQEDPLLMLDTIVGGTRSVLDFAVRHRARNFLMVSSGAVYGPQPAEVTNIPEEYSGAPDTMSPVSAYAEGKRMAELLCALYGRNHGFRATIARCFAFVGPYLPLDAHFAIGNFIRDALRGGPIIVKSDGKAYRSYLYAADLAIWLWRILFVGQGGVPYNVGSDQEITIADLAECVAKLCGDVEIRFIDETKHSPSSERFVPDVTRGKQQLGLNAWIALPEAIRRTVAYHRGIMLC